MTESADPRVGTVVAGRYRLVGRIGRGGMGAIYEATHLTTGKHFAVKTLLPGLGRIAEISKRFEREARAASLLAHPNIVSVVDFGALDDGALFLAMDLVSGRSLGEIAKEGVAPARAFAIMRQVLEALAHAHGEGVVHRDLKPDNVMLVDAGDSAEERDIVKLLDFGIAKLIDQGASLRSAPRRAEPAGAPEASADASGAGDTLTQAGVAFGTPDYMAPEQALGEDVDARADLYAAGVITYELLTGSRPFVSADKVAVLRMHVAVDAPPVDAARLVPEVSALLERALAKRRDDRFASAAEMIAALDVAAAAQEAFVAAGAPAGEAVLPIAPEDHLPAKPPPAIEDLASAHTLPLAPITEPVSRRMAAYIPQTPASRIALLGGGIVVAVLVLVAATRGGHDPPPHALPLAAPSLPLLLPAQKLLAQGDPAGAAALLEPAVAGPLARDQAAWLALGRARDLQNRDDAALAAFEKALALGSSTDAGLVTFVGDALRGRPKLAAAALELTPKMGTPGAKLLAEEASHGKANALRARARELAAAEGVADVDLVASFGLDLEHGSTCKERKEAVARLRALRDKRAIPVLRKAKGRRGGFLNLEDVNNCLDRDVVEAIDFLSALP